MRDYAREDSGATVVMASCVDDRFPPEHMLDGKDATFWMTTGMFPQEVVLKLRCPVHVSKITTLSLNVKKLAVEKCDSDKPDSFDRVFEVGGCKAAAVVWEVALVHKGHMDRQHTQCGQGGVHLMRGAELPNRGDRLQTEVHQVNIKARYLRFVLLSGHGELATINRVSVVGESLTGEQED